MIQDVFARYERHQNQTARLRLVLLVSAGRHHLDFAVDKTDILGDKILLIFVFHLRDGVDSVCRQIALALITVFVAWYSIMPSERYVLKCSFYPIFN